MSRDILFLAHRVPYPPDRGDKIRAFHVLRRLAAHGRVHLIAFADDARDEAAAEGLAPWTASRTIVRRTRSQPRSAVQALLTGRPVSIVAFDDPALHRATRAAIAAHAPSLVYIYSSQMAQFVPPHVPGARVVMDFVDVDSAKFAAYADTAGPAMAWLYRREGRVLLDYDRAVAARVDHGLFVSREEAALFRRLSDAPNIGVVENGIDTDGFDPAADFAGVDAAGPLIVFTGQMDYRPNVEGAAWFARDVLPLVRAAHPDARFAIVGRAPTAEVQALASDEVIVTGEVPDVRGWLAAASVVVAPLKLARGIQNKVLEAMAMARPVVASTAAAEGIDHAGTVHAAADTAAMAQAVTALLDDRGAAEALGLAARARVQARYGWAASLAPLDAFFDPSPDADRAAA